MKPRIFYLTEFPAGYLNQNYFYNLNRAKAFVKHIRDFYEIKGKVIKVKECPKTTKKKNQ